MESSNLSGKLWGASSGPLGLGAWGSKIDMPPTLLGLLQPHVLAGHSKPAIKLFRVGLLSALAPP